MRLAKFAKLPAERKRYVIDYSEWLDQGETLDAVTFTVTPATASPLEVDASSLGVPPLTVIYFVSGGLAGSTYEVTARAVTSGGQIKTDTILYSIQ
jgi:hypothetical protein